MAKATEPVDAGNPDTPPAEEPAPAEQEASTAESPAPAEPDPAVAPGVTDLPIDPPSPRDEAARQNVETAAGEAAYGQTVVTDTAGEARVVGTAKAEPEFDDAGAVVVPFDSELDASGTSHGVKTPLGVVTVSYEEDDSGVGRVAVSTSTDNVDFQLVADVDVLRHQPS